MTVTTIIRTFFLGQTQLEDINPSLSPESVLLHYSGVYPELTNATIFNKGLQDNNTLKYEFRTNIGTKG